MWLLLPVNTIFLDNFNYQSMDRPTVKRGPGSRRRTRIAPIVPVLALFLLVNLSMSLYQLPSNRLIERRLCIDYYRRTDPSKLKPGGSLDEKLCKIRDIEKDLGLIQGMMETLWVAGGSPTHNLDHCFHG